MEFYCTLLLAEVCPVEHFAAQGYYCGVHKEDFPLQTLQVLPLKAHMLSKMLQRQLEELLKDLVIPVLVDIRDAALAWSQFAAQVIFVSGNGS
jgi:hypothetical protein